MATPLYTTTATVALQNRAEQIVDLATPISGLGGDFFTINTEVEAMASRELIGKLVDKHDLVSDPVFNTRLRPKDDGWSPGKLIGGIRAALMPTPEVPVRRPRPRRSARTSSPPSWARSTSPTCARATSSTSP